jgi:hypothetical protein
MTRLEHLTYAIDFAMDAHKKNKAAGKIVSSPGYLFMPITRKERNKGCTLACLYYQHTMNGIGVYQEVAFGKFKQIGRVPAEREQEVAPFVCEYFRDSQTLAPVEYEKGKVLSYSY